MKKNYSKPEIVFESFKLSTSIAGTCELFGNQADPTNCEYDTGIGIIFATCEYSSQDGTEFGVCYDVPTGDPKVFGS